MVPIDRGGSGRSGAVDQRREYKPAMDVSIIFKIAAVGILVAVLNQVLKKAEKEEMAMLTSLAGVVVVLLMVIDMIGQLFQSIRSIFRLY